MVADNPALKIPKRRAAQGGSMSSAKWHPAVHRNDQRICGAGDLYDSEEEAVEAARTELERLRGQGVPLPAWAEPCAFRVEVDPIPPGTTIRVSLRHGDREQQVEMKEKLKAFGISLQLPESDA